MRPRCPFRFLMVLLLRLRHHPERHTAITDDHIYRGHSKDRDVSPYYNFIICESIMKILITGSSGYVGQHLLHYILSNASDIDFPGNENVYIIAAYGSLESFAADADTTTPIIGPIPSSRTMTVTRVGNVNLADASSMEQLLSIHDFDILIHLAAMGSLVECESNPVKTMAVNCPTATLLASLPSHCKIIHISTDQVYDGLNAPYTEDDPCHPVNTYGVSKLAFERALLGDNNTNNNRHWSVCLRSSLILGPMTPGGKCRKQSFLQFAVEALLQKEKTTLIFTDEYRSVIFVTDVIRIILWFAFSNDGTNVETYSGLYNMGGPDRVSRWDIINEIAARRNNLDDDMSHIQPVERSSLVNDIKSPADITMNITKMCSVTGLQMTSMKEIVRLSLP